MGQSGRGTPTWGYTMPPTPEWHPGPLRGTRWPRGAGPDPRYYVPWDSRERARAPCYYVHHITPLQDWVRQPICLQPDRDGPALRIRPPRSPGRLAGSVASRPWRKAAGGSSRARRGSQGTTATGRGHRSPLRGGLVLPSSQWPLSLPRRAFPPSRRHGGGTPLGARWEVFRGNFEHDSRAVAGAATVWGG